MREAENRQTHQGIQKYMMMGAFVFFAVIIFAKGCAEWDEYTQGYFWFSGLLLAGAASIKFLCKN